MKLPTTDPPSMAQLNRLAAFAKIAWDDEVPIRFGFRMTKGGIRIYVKQAKRGGNEITQEGSSAEVVASSMEKLFASLAANRLSEIRGKPVSESYVRNIVDSLVAP